MPGSRSDDSFPPPPQVRHVGNPVHSKGLDENYGASDRLDGTPAPSSRDIINYGASTSRDNVDFSVPSNGLDNDESSVPSTRVDNVAASKPPRLEFYQGLDGEEYKKMLAIEKETSQLQCLVNQGLPHLLRSLVSSTSPSYSSENMLCPVVLISFDESLLDGCSGFPQYPTLFLYPYIIQPFIIVG